MAGWRTDYDYDEQIGYRRRPLGFASGLWQAVRAYPGGLVEKTGTGDPHDMVLVRFTYALADYVATSNYGDLRVGEPGYLLDLDPDTVRCPDLAWIAPGRIPPHERAVGATFLLRVPLPARFNGEYDPANRPSSTPTLLKPGDRRRFTKPEKTKAQVRARTQTAKGGLSTGGQGDTRRTKGT